MWLFNPCSPCCIEPSGETGCDGCPNGFPECWLVEVVGPRFDPLTGLPHGSCWQYNGSFALKRFLDDDDPVGGYMACRRYTEEDAQMCPGRPLYQLSANLTSATQGNSMVLEAKTSTFGSCESYGTAAAWEGDMSGWDCRSELTLHLIREDFCSGWPEEVTIRPAGSGECHGGDYNCDQINCPGGVAESWSMSPGVANGDCDQCEDNLGGDVLLTFQSGVSFDDCHWVGDQPGGVGGCIGPFVRWGMRMPGPSNALQKVVLRISGILDIQWTLPLEDFDCLGTNTFFRDDEGVFSGNLTLCEWPDAITVEPD